MKLLTKEIIEERKSCERVNRNLGKRARKSKIAEERCYGREKGTFTQKI